MSSHHAALKIAIIMPVAEQRGGAEMALLHLVQHQYLDVEWQVIFLENGPMIAQFQSLGIKTYTVISGRLRELKSYSATVRHIAAILRREQVNGVVSWMAKPHLYGALAALGAGVPAFWFQMGLPSEEKIDIVATLLPAKGIFTCSETAKSAQERLWPKRPTKAIYLAVEMERFDPSFLPSPAEMRCHLGLPAKGPLIGIVGRLQRWKGMHVLIEAMPQVLAQYPDANCVLVGGEHSLEADYSGFLKERINALGLETQVILAGLQHNVQEWMQAMDIVVHASHNEPFGIVVIEAMALGKPLVAGDTAGPTEIITNGKDGLLTPYGNTEALAKALLRYLNNPEFASKVGESARLRAAAFSAQRYAEHFVKELRSMLS